MEKIYYKNTMSIIQQVLYGKINYSVKWLPHQEKLIIQDYAKTKEIAYDAKDNSDETIKRLIERYEGGQNEK